VKTRAKETAHGTWKRRIGFLNAFSQQFLKGNPFLLAPISLSRSEIGTTMVR
jgi:hypothetical protein